MTAHPRAGTAADHVAARTDEQAHAAAPEPSAETLQQQSQHKDLLHRRPRLVLLFLAHGGLAPSIEHLWLCFRARAAGAIEFAVHAPPGLGGELNQRYNIERAYGGRYVEPTSWGRESVVYAQLMAYQAILRRYGRDLSAETVIVVLSGTDVPIVPPSVVLERLAGMDSVFALPSDGGAALAKLWSGLT